MEYILGVVIRDRIGGQVSSDEIGLPVKSTGLCIALRQYSHLAALTGCDII